MIEVAIIDLDVDAIGNATFDDMEATLYGAELYSVDWPDNADVDIIETSDPYEDGANAAVLSMPLDVYLRIYVELSISVLDSTDRQYNGVGRRSVEYDETREVRATVSVKLHDLGGEDQKIEFLFCEINLRGLDIDVGEVDVFGLEDYYDDRRE